MIRNGGDRGKLRTQDFAKVAAMAILQSLLSRGEHWPGEARSSAFTKSNKRVSAFLWADAELWAVYPLCPSRAREQPALPHARGSSRSFRNASEI